VKYYYDKADIAGMKQELSTIDWEEKLSTQDENKQWKFFKDASFSKQSLFSSVPLLLLYIQPTSSSSPPTNLTLIHTDS
jgi:hypothetical protein